MSSEESMVLDPEMPVLERQDTAAGTSGRARSRRGLKQYEVEELLGKRWNCEFRTFQYLVKWKGYDVNESTWEDFDRLECPEILKQYEKANDLPTIMIQRVPVREPTGFETGLWPKEITGISERVDDETEAVTIFYKVEWDGDRKPEWISSKDLVERVPMMVLLYMQKLVHIEEGVPNGVTKDVQIKKHWAAVNDCKKIIEKEAKKAKNEWARTRKLADME